MSAYDDSIAKELHLQFIESTGNTNASGIPTYQPFELVENERIESESMSLTVGILEGTQFQLGSYVIPEMTVTFTYNGNRYKDKYVRAWLTMENDMSKVGDEYETAPIFNTDKFYEKADNEYILLADVPDDWEENFGNYYFQKIHGLIFGKVYQELLSDNRQQITLTIRNVLYDTFNIYINWNSTFFEGVPANRENNETLNLKMRSVNDFYRILMRHTICYGCSVYDKTKFDDVISDNELIIRLNLLRNIYADFTPYGGTYSDNYYGYTPLSDTTLYPSQPTFVANKFYEKSGNTYDPLVIQPLDWNNNWTSYYEYTGLRIKYIAQLNYNENVPDSHSGFTPGENEYTLDYTQNKNIYLGEIWRQFGELAGVHWCIPKPKYNSMLDINSDIIRFENDVDILPIRILCTDVLMPSEELLPGEHKPLPLFSSGAPLPFANNIPSPIPFYISCIYDEMVKTKYQGVQYKDSGVFLIDDSADIYTVSSYEFQSGNLFFDCGYRAALNNQAQGTAGGYSYYQINSTMPDFPDCPFYEHIKSLRGQNSRKADTLAGGYGYFYKDYLCNLDKIINATLDCIYDPNLYTGQMVSVELADGFIITIPLISCQINGINLLSATYRTTAISES